MVSVVSGDALFRTCGDQEARERDDHHRYNPLSREGRAACGG